MRGLRFLLVLISFFIAGFADETKLNQYPFPILKFFPKIPLAENNPVTVEGADLGKYLFYDPILSSDSSMSCSSCHKQQFAFSDSPARFSTGRNGVLMKRNTMPLFNLAWYPSFFWDGRAQSIEAQVFHPLRELNEMNLDWHEAASRLSKNIFYSQKFSIAFCGQQIDSITISKAIAQFLRTLISYRSKYDKVLNGEASFTPDEYEGFVLMNEQTKGDCIHCHNTDGGVLGTTMSFSNNGLDMIKDPGLYSDKGRGGVTGKIEDNGKFMIPSLRNLSFTTPYMHDGRFKTLDEVLDYYSEGLNHTANIDSKMEFVSQGGVRLNKDEKNKIIAFLLTLSDSVFVSDAEFKNPFEK